VRRWARTRIPDAVVDRPKQPYRAPDAAAFFGPEAPGWVEDLLSPAAVDDAGLFDSAAVDGLVRRCRAGRATGFRENQALVGVLSGQLWHEAFLRRAPAVTPLSFEGADVVLHESQGVPAPAMEGR
jgi:asparagine synthase (glutamine-hydrolysing)